MHQHEREVRRRVEMLLMEVRVVLLMRWICIYVVEVMKFRFLLVGVCMMTRIYIYGWLVGWYVYVVGGYSLETMQEVCLIAVSCRIALLSAPRLL